MALPQVQLIAAELTDVDYPEADLQGELRLVGGSLLLNQYLVVWPAGTSWDDDLHAVSLPDGTRLFVGNPVRLSGGIVQASVAKNYGATTARDVNAYARTTGAEWIALVSGGLPL